MAETLQQQIAKLQSEMAKLTAENAALQAQVSAQPPKGVLYLKVTEGAKYKAKDGTEKVGSVGAISLGGMGQWPITLYLNQWENVFKVITNGVKILVAKNNLQYTKLTSPKLDTMGGRLVTFSEFVTAMADAGVLRRKDESATTIDDAATFADEAAA